LPETPPCRSHLFAGATGNLEHFTQDLACLREGGGRHDGLVLTERRLQMMVESIDEKRGWRGSRVVAAYCSDALSDSM
jgi:hypothetical protein